MGGGSTDEVRKGRRGGGGTGNATLERMIRIGENLIEKEELSGGGETGNKAL